MEFDIMRLFDDNSYISPGTIGGKIKKFREIKKWSQKHLGILCGFSAATADVRIAQYEKNKKVPREKALKDIAGALGLDEGALFDADLLPYNTMYHALFDIEDFYGLHPVKKEDGYYLEFSGPCLTNPDGVYKDYDSFLEIWYKMRQKYMPNSSDTPEEKTEKENEYALWKGGYPGNEARKFAEEMRDRRRERRLQAELDELYAKRNTESELSKIENEIKEVKSEVAASYTPIKFESEFIYILKDSIEKGLKVERFSPEDRMEIDYDFIHLLSIKTDDILSSEENKKLYSRIVCAIETMQHNGINILQSITSRNKDLYVTYKYPYSQGEYLDNVYRCWGEIDYILERKPFWSKKEIDDLEDKFKADITGENDVILSIGEE